MKKRKDSFFGIHFDFHAVPGQTVGETVRPDIIGEMLDRVKPDYVQCDTKGHHGLSSYPTKVGNRADFIKEDTLKIWRKLTKERDIALYAHHSGLFERKAVQLHPDWAIKNEKGEISRDRVSPFSPYADELLIPQLKELALDYDLDGAWIDGDCWSAFVDYSDYAVSAYRQKYGKEPPVSADADYEEYREFCRQGFRDYVKHYIDEVKKAKPSFEITSNWLYSGYMPEKADINVDFISGDYAPNNSVETARHDSRSLAARNIPWDLLSWGQNTIPLYNFESMNRNTKEYEQLCQEAAEVISCGGGFEFFNILYGGGGMIQKWAIPVWEKVADFCRKREFCHKAKAVLQIGILFAHEVTDINTEAVYNKDYICWNGTCSWNNALLDSGFSTQFIFESEETDYSRYPVIVIPETVSLSSETVKNLKDYAENGGHLIIDLKSAKYFEDFAGLKSEKFAERIIFLKGRDALSAACCDFAEFSGDAEETGTVYDKNYFESEHRRGAICKNTHKGNMTFMCMDFGSLYRENVATASKDFLKEVIYKTGFEPMAEISGSSYAELCLTQKDDKLIINIINTAGQSGILKVRSFSEVPKIGPLKVRLKTEKPVRMTQMPENKEIKYNYTNGFAEFEIDTVHIHTAAIVEY